MRIRWSSFVMGTAFAPKLLCVNPNICVRSTVMVRTPEQHLTHDSGANTMDDETRLQAQRDRLEARRGNHWSRVSFRSLSEIADGLIERVQAYHAANDNKPSPRKPMSRRDE